MDYILLLSALAFLFGLFGIVHVVYDISRKKRMQLVHIFNLTYVFTYGFYLSIIIFLHKVNQIQFTRRISYDSSNLKSLWIWFGLAVLGYIVFNFAYRPQSVFNKLKAETTQTEEERGDKRLQLTAIICLAIGLVSLYLWSRAYGGIFKLIDQADAVRNNASKVSNAIAFFKHPAKLVTIVSYVSLYLILKKHHRVLNILIFAVSIVASLLYLLANDGRMSMALYFAVLFLISGRMFENISIWKVIKLSLVVALGAAIVLNMDNITYWLRNSTYGTRDVSHPFLNILNEYSFIIAAAQTSINFIFKGHGSMMLLKDISCGVFAWLPNSIKPQNLVNIWTLNTNLKFANPTGQNPCDFVSTSIYDAGMFGTIILGTFWARIIKWIDQKHQNRNTPFFEVIYCYFALSVFRLVDYCLLYDVMMNMFCVFIAAIIWFGSGLIFKKAKDQNQTQEA